MIVLPQIDYIVGIWDFTKGVVRDFSESGNDGVLYTPIRWQNTHGIKGLTGGIPAGAGRVQVAHDTSLQISGDATIGLYSAEGIYSNGIGGVNDQTLFSKFQTEYWFFIRGGTNLFRVYQGNTLKINTTKELTGENSIAIRFPASGNLDAHLNGVLFFTGGTSNPNTSTNNFIMLNNTSNNMAYVNSAVNCYVFWNGITLSGDEIAQFHEWGQERFSSSRRKVWIGSNFRPDLSIDDGHMLGSWNLGDMEGLKVGDRGPDNVGLTATKYVQKINGNIGNAIRFNGNGRLYNASGIDTSSGVTVVLTGMVRELASVGNQQIFVESTKSSSNRFGIGYQTVAGPAIELRARWYDGVAGDYAKSGSGMIGDKYYHIVCTFNGSDTLKLYLNGNELTGTNTLTLGTADEFSIGSDSAGTGNFLDGEIKEIEFFDEVKGDDWIKDNYREYSENLVIYDNMDDYQISVSTEGGEAGRPISNTIWAVGEATVRAKIVNELIESSYNKVCECTTAGIIYANSNESYGYWEFLLYKGADVNSVSVTFLGNHIEDTSGANLTGYSIIINSSEQVVLYKNNAGTNSNLFITASSYVANSIWYRFKVLRRYDGRFTVYIKGGLFINWTLVDVSGGSGTNPVIDNTIITSKYAIVDLDVGDKFSQFEVRRGDFV